MKRDDLLLTLAALLDFRHVESARLILAEIQHRPLGEPNADPLQWVDDDDLQALRDGVNAEIFRRDRLLRTHFGDLVCRLARRIEVGDVICLPKDGNVADCSVERQVQEIVSDGPDALFFAFTDGGERLRRRPGEILVVKKLPARADPA